MTRFGNQGEQRCPSLGSATMFVLIDWLLGQDTVTKGGGDMLPHTGKHQVVLAAAIEHRVARKPRKMRVLGEGLLQRHHHFVLHGQSNSVYLGPLDGGGPVP